MSSQDNNPNPQTDTLKKQYQDILDKYSEQIAQTQPEPDTQTSTDIQSPQPTESTPLNPPDNQELPDTKPLSLETPPSPPPLSNSSSPLSLPENDQDPLPLKEAKSEDLPPPDQSNLPSSSETLAPKTEKTEFFEDILSNSPSPKQKSDLEKILNDSSPQEEITPPLKDEESPPPVDKTDDLPSTPPSPESEFPQDIQEDLSDLAISNLSNDQDPKPEMEKSGPNIAKIFFIFSVIVFISVLGAIAYNIFKDQSSVPIQSEPVSSPQDTTPVETEFCFLNDKNYAVGETFSAADGCNTCSCSETKEIVCTEMACDLTPADSSSSSPLNDTVKDQ